MEKEEKCIHNWKILSNWCVMNDIIVRRKCLSCGKVQDGSFNVTDIKKWSDTPKYGLSKKNKQNND